VKDRRRVGEGNSVQLHDPPHNGLERRIELYMIRTCHLVELTSSCGEMRIAAVQRAVGVEDESGSKVEVEVAREAISVLRAADLGQDRRGCRSNMDGCWHVDADAMFQSGHWRLRMGYFGHVTCARCPISSNAIAEFARDRRSCAAES